MISKFVANLVFENVRVQELPASEGLALIAFELNNKNYGLGIVRENGVWSPFPFIVHFEDESRIDQVCSFCGEIKGPCNPLVIHIDDIFEKLKSDSRIRLKLITFSSGR